MRMDSPEAGASSADLVPLLSVSMKRWPLRTPPGGPPSSGKAAVGVGGPGVGGMSSVARAVTDIAGPGVADGADSLVGEGLGPPSWAWTWLIVSAKPTSTRRTILKPDFIARHPLKVLPPNYPIPGRTRIFAWVSGSARSLNA